MADIWIPLVVGLGGFVGAWLLHPWVTHRFSLARGYYAPFSMWCAKTASVIDELLDWVKRKPTLTGQYETGLAAYQLTSNFLEIHELLAQAFQHGWTSELERKGDLPTLLKANYLVERGYHMGEVRDKVIWSVLDKNEREHRLYDKAVANRLWDDVFSTGAAQDALRSLRDALRRYVPVELPRWVYGFLRRVRERRLKLEKA